MIAPQLRLSRGSGDSKAPPSQIRHQTGGHCACVSYNRRPSSSGRARGIGVASDTRLCISASVTSVRARLNRTAKHPTTCVSLRVHGLCVKQKKRDSPWFHAEQHRCEMLTATLSTKPAASLNTEYATHACGLRRHVRLLVHASCDQDQRAVDSRYNEVALFEISLNPKCSR